MFLHHELDASDHILLTTLAKAHNHRLLISNNPLTDLRPLIRAQKQETSLGLGATILALEELLIETRVPEQDSLLRKRQFRKETVRRSAGDEVEDVCCVVVREDMFRRLRLEEHELDLRTAVGGAVVRWTVERFDLESVSRYP